jgi:hypothetical protein
MNIVEVQDNLKNFSQDQLINEINQPSGMVPQFLVLTELGRRNRIKQDMEGRQAQNQPTVAQEVVSAAGVPQGGIMDMARSMAPKSSIEQNDAVNMMADGGKVDKPRNRFEAMMAYLRGLGADSDEEIEEATGKSIAEMINFGGDYRTAKKADGGVVKMQQGTVVYKGKTYFTDGTYVAEKGASGRIVPVDDPEIVEAVTNKSPSVQSNVEGIKNISTNVEDFAPNIPFSTTADPELDMSALDPVLGIRPEMIPQFPDQGNPLFSSDKDTSKAVSEIAGVNPLIDRAAAEAREESLSTFPIQTFQQNQPQTQELLLPTAQPTGRQSLDGRMVSTVGPTADEIERAQKVLEMNPVTASDAELEVLGEGLKKNTALQNFLNRDPEQDSNLFPELNFSNDPTKGISDPGGGLESYFGTTESAMEDPLNAKNVLTAATQSANADEFNDAIRSLQRSKGELEGGIPSDELSFEPFNNQPPAPFLPSGSGDTPDELMVPFDNTPSKGKGGDDGGDGDDDDTGGGTKGGSALGSLESEIANMLKENEEDREKDKYLALAKMGLALMSSSQPTFGGALGEAGMAGLDDLQASRKSYRDDKITLLDAQRKLEQARATAASKSKSGLTGSNVVSLLNNARTRMSSTLAEIAKQTSPSVGDISLTEEDKMKKDAAVEALRRDAAKLAVEIRTYESMLGGIGSLGVDLDATAN